MGDIILLPGAAGRRMRTVYKYVNTLAGPLPGCDDPQSGKSVTQKVQHVLFVCSGNSGRSIMAEAMLRKLGAGRFAAYSAGSHPTGRINAITLEELQRRSYPTSGLASKSWSAFVAPDSVPLDFVITVCEKVAAERHPAWRGSPLEACWKFRAPGSVQGTDKEVRAVFTYVCGQIETAINDFIRLPWDEPEPGAAAHQLRQIMPS